jgi:hypothetical protein
VDVTDKRIIQLRGRGYTVEATARALGIGERAVYKRMRANPEIATEADRLLEQLDPQAWDVLRQAMNAMKGDGIDWPSRNAAAKAAHTIPSEGTIAPENQTVNLHVTHHRDGTETVEILEQEEGPLSEASEYVPSGNLP